jgi:hypothetical protein
MKGYNSGSTMERNLMLARLSTIYFPQLDMEMEKTAIRKDLGKPRKSTVAMSPQSNSSSDYREGK